MDRKPTKFLLALALLAAAWQVWRCQRAVVPAVDAVRFVALAQAFSTHGWPALAGESRPVFPVIVAITHAGLTRGGLAPTWGDAVQAAAALPLVLLPWPLFFLLRRWHHPAVAWTCAAILPLWPCIARIGPDGLAEGWYLLGLASTAACLAHASPARAFPAHGDGQFTGRGQSGWLCFGIAAVAFAFTCGVRREAWLLPASVGLASAAEAVRRRFRDGRWTRTLCRTTHAPIDAAGERTLCAVAAPLENAAQEADGERRGRPTTAQGAWVAAAALVLCGTAWWTFGPSPSAEAAPSASADPAARAALLNEPRTNASKPAAFPVRRWKIPTRETAVSSRFEGSGAAARRLVQEYFAATWYVLPLLAAAGVVSRARRSWHVYDAVALAYFLASLFGLTALAGQVGYLAGRHLLPLVALTLIGATAGAADLGSAWAKRGLHANRRATTAAVAAGGILVGMLVAESGKPLHASRFPHRQAAEWLAAATEAGAVYDTRGWTALYSGRPTYRVDAVREALADARLAFLVLEASELRTDSSRGRALAELTSRHAEPRASFAGIDAGNDPVLIYRWRGALSERSEGEVAVSEPRNAGE